MGKSFRNRFSRIMGRLASAKVGNILLKPMVKLYIRFYKIDMDDFSCNLTHIKSFNQFFTRELKPGRRPLGKDIVSPVDGVLSEFGAIKNNTLLQVKGHAYNLSELFEKNMQVDNWSYATLYLSPADYHRIHAPFNLTVEKMIYLPGTLFSVSLSALKKHEKIFCRNERIILSGNSKYGKYHLVFVGAVVVGCIRLTFDSVVSNIGMQKTVKEYQNNLSFNKGNELGLFELGSTVVLIMENDILSEVDVTGYEAVKLGETLKTINT